MDLVKNFNKTNGFPRCLGAIDGSHIEIKQPRINSSDYINRKELTLLTILLSGWHIMRCSKANPSEIDPVSFSMFDVSLSMET